MYAPTSPTGSNPGNQVQHVLAKNINIINSQTVYDLSLGYLSISFSVNIQINQKGPKKCHDNINSNWAAFKTDIKQTLQIQRHLNSNQDVDTTTSYLMLTINVAIDRKIPTLELDNQVRRIALEITDLHK